MACRNRNCRLPHGSGRTIRSVRLHCLFRQQYRPHPSPSIPDWRDTDLDDIGCIARIDGEVVGQGSARRLPGGVWTALAFALAEARVRDLPLEPGMLISTGAVTGMHAMAEGWKAEADFGAFGTVACVGVAMPT